MTDESVELKDQTLGSNVDAGASSVPATPAEKMLSASRVNEIVQERTREVSTKAYDRGYKEAEQKLKSSMGGMSQLDDDQINQLIDQRFSQRIKDLTEQHNHQEYEKKQTEIANDFIGKLAAAKDKYPDLLANKDDIVALGELAPYINQLSEVPAITDHLLKNELQVAGLLTLVKNPSLLKRALGKLEASIKVNQNEFPDVDEPSEQISPSSYKADNDSGSIEALKKQSWLRG